MTTTLSETAASLLQKYQSSLHINPDLSRRIVSFQANKQLPFYSWYKYKEGFSKELVDYCLDDSKLKGTLLDPFAGSGAALFVANQRGFSSIGIELLPSGIFPIKSRISAQTVDVEKLSDIINQVLQIDDFSKFYEVEFTHVPITKGAFSDTTEKELMGYVGYINKLVIERKYIDVLEFAALCILEQISFTRKDGQFLRWDHRSGRKNKFDKGRIYSFNEAIKAKLTQFSEDLSNHIKSDFKASDIKLLQGSCLEKLFDIDTHSIDVVITSPPYCNRYDYTRSYALELAFLGSDADEFKKLRQTMLSCTVENLSKEIELEEIYSSKGRKNEFNKCKDVFENQKLLMGILKKLESIKKELPNKGVIRMIRNYFFEMNLVIQHLSRIMKSGGKIYMVNDNVQYAGIEVPVDLILSDFAEEHGLRTDKIWVLPKGKGNASQQMGVHGRNEIRKCVYVWEKEHLL